jgi:hypothetical protein
LKKDYSPSASDWNSSKYVFNKNFSSITNIPVSRDNKIIDSFSASSSNSINRSGSIKIMDIDKVFIVRPKFPGFYNFLRFDNPNFEATPSNLGSSSND